MGKPSLPNLLIRHTEGTDNLEIWEHCTWTVHHAVIGNEVSIWVSSVTLYSLLGRQLYLICVFYWFLFIPLRQCQYFIDPNGEIVFLFLSSRLLSEHWVSSRKAPPAGIQFLAQGHLRQEKKHLTREGLNWGFYSHQHVPAPVTICMNELH